MKNFMFILALLPLTALAEVIDVSTYKSLLQQNKSTLEEVHAGMGQQLITTGTVTLENGTCKYTTNTTLSILKVLNDKLIVHVKEVFTPDMTVICEAAGYEPNEQTYLYYDVKPTVEQELKNIDEISSSIQSVKKDGSLIIVQYLFSENNQKMSVTYDLNRSMFKNVISNINDYSSTLFREQADLNLSTVDLKDILFCDNNDGDYADCARGDYSDILF